ncbi:hypothetical protein SAMN05421813_10710 [Daejeonella rubra]|uniref:Uncharacterized protein n=1 Tax=Daejeonella rubra TaxID=990371 RepID=A0A1G9QYB3_9SPHI|nr:hypothetical protein [Daejeonella rubra]SDM15964.1 hypothetical protein SAMN05421813_10710 [Daejeonella rubra]
MKKFGFILMFLLVVSISCKTQKKTRAPKIDVPIAINIEAESSASANFINLSYYRFQLLNELEQFQSINFVLVDADENPDVVLDITIENFTLWPKDERVSRRRVSRNIVAGTDSNGKPVYQTVTASVDIVQIQQRTNARFKTSLLIKAETPVKFQKTFIASYNYVNTYVDNIQGDPRALDPSISMSRGMGIEPTEDEYILILSKREMTRRLGDEIRKFYDSKTKVPK